MLTRKSPFEHSALFVKSLVLTISFLNLDQHGKNYNNFVIKKFNSLRNHTWPDTKSPIRFRWKNPMKNRWCPNLNSQYVLSMFYISKYSYFKSLEQIPKSLNPVRGEQSTSRSSVRWYISIAPQTQVMLHANDFVQYKTSENDWYCFLSDFSTWFQLEIFNRTISTLHDKKVHVLNLDLAD